MGLLIQSQGQETFVQDLKAVLSRLGSEERCAEIPEFGGPIKFVKLKKSPPPSKKQGLSCAATFDSGDYPVESFSCSCRPTFATMSMVYPVNASPFQSWRPFASGPAVSLTQNLAPETDAKCLLLGCGDSRNILFTIFNDENNREPCYYEN